MDITTLEYKPSKTRNQGLINFHPMGDFKLPFQAKNGFDKDPPFIFMQHEKYIEIWDIGYYTDYPLTWARGLAHFAYTINELLGGSPLEVINLKDHDHKAMIYDIDQFQNEWLRENKGYHSIVEELIEIGLHE